MVDLVSKVRHGPAYEKLKTQEVMCPIQIHRSFSCLFKCTLLFPILLSAGKSEGAILLYEGFDSSKYNTTGGYPSSLPPGGATDALVWDPDTTVAGDNHVGQGPPVFGFASSPWQHGNSIAASVYAKLENSQAPYTNGGSLVTTTGQLNIRRTSGTTGNKSFSRDLSLLNGTTSLLPGVLYISGLITRTATAFNIHISSSNSISNPETVETRAFRMSVDTAGLVTFTGAGSSTTVSDSPIWDGTFTPTFFVMKIENAVLNESSPTSGDKITLYLNPDLSSEGANVPAMEFGSASSGFYVTGNSTWAMDRITLSADPATGGSVVFDELRFATTWWDAHAAIPEPHSALIVMLPLAGCALRRRRSGGR